jgi:hypothetical protein
MLFDSSSGMKTKGPHQSLSLSLADTDFQEGRRPGVIATTMSWIQQGLCALHGHDALLQYERNRIFLRCTSCGHETPGWDLSRTRAAAAPAEAPARPAAADLAEVA